MSQLDKLKLEISDRQQLKWRVTPETVRETIISYPPELFESYVK